MSLWSSELDIVIAAIECFALMNEEAGLLLTLDGTPIHPAPLYTAYYKFSHETQQITTGIATHYRCSKSNTNCAVNVKEADNKQGISNVARCLFISSSTTICLIVLFY